MADIETPQRSRPNPAEWIWYSFGGRLSPSLRAWVLKDTTGRTWVLRHVLRSALYIAPCAALILAFMPGAFWIRGTAVIGGTLMGLLFGLAYIVETTETRLLKAGYPAGLGESIRRNRSAGNRTAALAQRQEAALARRRRHMSH